MHNLLLLIISFSILISVSTTFAQNKDTDSIEKLLRTYKKDDTVKVKLLNEKANAFHLHESEKILKYATQAYDLANKLNFEIGKIESLRYIAKSYALADKKTALGYLQKALNLAEAAGNNIYAIHCLKDIASNYKNSGQDSLVIAYYQRALTICRKINNIKEEALCINDVSFAYYEQGKIELAIDGFQKVIPMFQRLGDKKQTASALVRLGTLYATYGNPPMALDCFEKCRMISEELKFDTGIYVSLLNIGNIYSGQNNFQKAIDYYSKALKKAEALNDKARITTCLLNIGGNYMLSNNSLALAYFQKTLQNAKELKNNYLIQVSLEKTGIYYEKRNDLENALDYYKQAIKISNDNGLKNEECLPLYYAANIYLKQKKYGEALKYSLMSMKIASELKLKGQQKEIYRQLSEIYAATNDYKKAYSNFKLFKDINDSIYNQANIKRIAELEYKYKFEKEKQAIALKNQKEDALQQAEKKRLTFILVTVVVVLLFLLFFALFILRLYRHKRKINILLTEQKQKIQEKNEEYLALNEELHSSNEQLSYTKNLVEKSEKKLKKIIEQIRDALVIIDTDGQIVIWNSGAEKITHLSTNETLHKKLTGILFQLAPPQLKNNDEIEKTIEGIVTFKTPDLFNRFIDTELLLSDKSVRNIQCILFPIDMGTHYLFGAVCRDITEKNYIEKQLEEYNETKQKLLSMEVNRINQELEINQKSMTAATLKLIQNSERDNQTIEKLLEIEKNTNLEGKQQINTLITDYKRLSYNSNWKEFEILFEKVHLTFYEKLNAKYPNLTANERKICAFLKLNMSSKDISQITFQSEDALKKARLRLRQKLEIDRETNLTTFLQNI